MKRPIVLGLVCFFVFAAVAALLIKLMPSPVKDSDFLVVGSVATFVALLALFFAAAPTLGKSTNLFFTRRKKK